MQKEPTEPSFTELLLWIVGSFFRNLKRIALFTFACTSIIIGIVFFLKKQYIAEAVLFVPTDESGPSLKNALKDMGGLGDIVGLGSQTTSPGTDLMITIIKSRQFHDKIIKEFNLVKEYDIDTTKPVWPTLIFKETTKNLVYDVTDEDALYIGFKDTSATKAKAITARIVGLLDSSYSYIMKERTHEGRVFYEQKLKQTDSNLQIAQKKLSNFQEVNNILDPEVQIETSLKSNADLEAKAMALRIEKQVQISLKGSESEDLAQYETELKSTEQELNRISTGKVKGLEFADKKAISKLSTYYALFREFKIQESLYKLIRQKYEEKLMDENKNLRNLVVIQEPWVNNKKVSPPRASIVICTFLMSILVSLLYYIIKESLIQSASKSQRLNVALEDLKKSFTNCLK